LILNTPIKTGAVSAVCAAVMSAVSYMQGLSWDFTAIEWSLVPPWLTVLAGAFGLGGKIAHEKPRPTLDYTQPIGIRHNNPGNLRPSGDKWRGAIGEERGFLIFDSPLHGLRAMARNIKSQQRKHGLRTISSMMQKYAPESENDTQAYIEFISKSTGFSAYEQLDLTNNLIVVKLMAPMIRMENGSNPYSSELMNQAVQLA